MNFLLDTHVWLWSQEMPEKLGPKAKAGLIGGDNILYISTVSTLEIARLVDLGTIELSGTLTSWIQDSIGSLRVRTLDMSHEVAIQAYSLLPPFHKDPADRILVGTAEVHDLTLLTADDRILSYPHVQSKDARQ
ncbi:MAG: type II toxin-antitoxin system VapC family toxin [Acidobacteriota bacterium]